MNPNHDYNTALHEASHGIAADFYGVPNYPEVTPNGFSRVKESCYPGTAGLCHLEKPFTKYQDCVISWAGMLGECMYGTGPGWAPPFKPSEKLLREFWMMTMHQLPRLSDTDRLGILGDYKRSWRACRSAFRIIRKNRPRIVRLAKALLGTHAEKPVPMPETFPATLADFLQLVIGGTAPEEKLRAFVHDQAEKFLAQPQFALDREQLHQAVESWTAARLEHYRQGFTGPDAWQSAARAFRAWTAKNQPIKCHEQTT